MLKVLTPADARQLRDFFVEAGYTEERIRQEPRLVELYAARQAQQLPLPDHLHEPSGFNQLLAWFYLCEDSEIDAAAALIRAPILALLVDSGMLARDANLLRPAVMLTPHQGFVFASDTRKRWQSHADDLVIWPNATSRSLDQSTIRRRCDAALDLGTGCGIQAILASSHCGQITATDLNSRAVEFTRFNAWLNGVDNVEAFVGDTFEPVHDRTFDLILANPPFFVTPSGGQLYSENSMELDQYCRRIVKESASHLKPGGFAQMVLEWVQVRGEAWQDRLREWIAGTGCDAWIFRTYARAAASYARERISQSHGSPADSDPFPRWMEYYERRGVEEIHGGLLAMRRREGTNWVRIEELSAAPAEPFGDAIWQSFACVDFAELQNDDALLAAKPRLVPGACLEEISHQSGGRWRSAALTLRVTAGIPVSMRVDSGVARFLAALDGSRTLEEVIATFAAELSADPGQVRRECLAVVRRLMGRRLILP